MRPLDADAGADHGAQGGTWSSSSWPSVVWRRSSQELSGNGDCAIYRPCSSFPRSMRCGTSWRRSRAPETSGSRSGDEGTLVRLLAEAKRGAATALAKVSGASEELEVVDDDGSGQATGNRGDLRAEAQGDAVPKRAVEDNA